MNIFSEVIKSMIGKSLRQLEDEIFEITKKQNQISNWNLSDEVKEQAIKELQSQKRDLKELMHNKVDDL